MGFGYRKRKKIAPGLFANLSRAASDSASAAEARASAGALSGRRQVSLGWKGLFWRKRI